MSKGEAPMGVYNGARTWEMSVGQHVEQKSRGFRAAPLALLKSGEDNKQITLGLEDAIYLILS